MNKLSLVLIALLLVLPIASAGFEHTDITGDLDLSSKLKLGLRQLLPFTTAGQQRGCEEYPSSSGIESAGTKTISCDCSTGEALINFYYVTSNGWHYLYEKESPYTFHGTNYDQWAWECYCCPAEEQECVTGNRECVTESKYKICSDGSWSTSNCNYDETCADGYCHSNADDCVENWACSAWSECTSIGKQYRSCSDTNHCGTTKYKPSTQQTCEYNPDNGGNGGNIPYKSYIIVGGLILVGIGGYLLWRRR